MHNLTPSFWLEGRPDGASRLRASALSGTRRRLEAQR